MPYNLHITSARKSIDDVLDKSAREIKKAIIDALSGVQHFPKAYFGIPQEGNGLKTEQREALLVDSNWGGSGAVFHNSAIALLPDGNLYSFKFAHAVYANGAEMLVLNSSTQKRIPNKAYVNYGTKILDELEKLGAERKKTKQ